MKDNTVRNIADRTNPEPIVSTELVTPELAAEWLALNEGNRKPKVAAIRALAEDMINGDWKFNGEPIKFGVSGRLIDGQHRLEAIVRTGLTQTFVVIRNVPEDAQITMDNGARRSFDDFLQFMGESNTRALSATVRNALRESLGDRNENSGRVGERQITYQEMWDFLQDNPGLRESARFAKNFARNNMKLPTALLGPLHFLLSSIDPEDTEAFFERLGTPYGHSENDPISLLRTSLIKDIEATGSRGQRWRRGMVVKAWNLWRDGKTASLLRYSPGGKTPEAYPEPH